MNAAEQYLANRAGQDAITIAGLLQQIADKDKTIESLRAQNADLQAAKKPEAPAE